MTTKLQARRRIALLPADVHGTLVLVCKRSGISFAMAHPSVQVEHQADAITRSPADEAFANAVGRFSLYSGARRAVAAAA